MFHGESLSRGRRHPSQVLCGVNRDTGGLRRTDRNGICWRLSREAGSLPAQVAGTRDACGSTKLVPPHTQEGGVDVLGLPLVGEAESRSVFLTARSPPTSRLPFPSPLPSPHNVTTNIRRDDTEPTGTFQRRKPDGEKSGAHHLPESRSYC